MDVIAGILDAVFTSVNVNPASITAREIVPARWPGFYWVYVEPPHPQYAEVFSVDGKWWATPCVYLPKQA
jgi:hypothetical protein